MPQIVDRVDFACADVDSSQWPKLSCGAANQLLLQESSLRLESDRSILFQDNGQIGSFDDNHKLVFNRAGNRLELHEMGEIRFLTGGPTPTERLRIDTTGNVEMLTDSAKLLVAGEIQCDGRLSVGDDVTITGNLSVSGATTLAANAQVQGNLQVSGFINAAEIRQNNAPLVGSQWANATGGINFAGGNVGIGDATPGEQLDVAGRIKTGTLTIGPWPANSAYVFFGANVLNQAQAGNYALLQDASGAGAGTTFLNSPQQIHFRINNGDRMFLANNGNVGIGTTNPQQRLHVAGPYLRVDGAGNEQIYIGGDGAGNDVQLGSFNANVKNVAVWNAGNNTRMNFFVNDLFYTGNVTKISDARLKTNVQPLRPVLAAIEQLRAVSFDWNELYHTLGGGERQTEIGVLAQEVEAVFPALVSTWGDQGYKGVDYSKLAVVLLAAIKELHGELQQLKAKLR